MYRSIMVVLMMVFIAVPSFSANKTVGKVLSKKGKVFYKKKMNSSNKKLKINLRLKSKYILVVQNDESEITILALDGTIRKYDKKGEYSLESIDATYSYDAMIAIKNKVKNRTLSSSLGGQRGTDDDSLPIHTSFPDGLLTVKNAVFLWKARENTNIGTVQLTVTAEGNEMFLSVLSNINEGRFDVALDSAKDGAKFKYEIAVKTKSGDESKKEGEFRLISPEEKKVVSEEIKKIESTDKELYMKYFLYSLVYKKYGLNEEAQNEFQKIQKENPEFFKLISK